jgi:4-hydroxybenzoate polyprenyltransferase
VAAISIVAGGEPLTAARLGLAMLALQCSIGALNDIVDAPHDAGRKPGKPIPAGLISRRSAQAVAVGAAVVGLALTMPSGPLTVAMAVAVLAIGYAYDLAAKGTAWSWLPFAIGIPLLPVFAWYGTAAALPSFFRVLVPAAVGAGAALAIANARADLERDVAAGIDSIAIRLGHDRAWLVSTTLFAIIAIVAVVTMFMADARTATVVGAIAGIAVIGIGVDAGRNRSPRHLERAWEFDAVGVALLAAAWLAGVAGAG